MQLAECLETSGGTLCVHPLEILEVLSEAFPEGGAADERLPWVTGVVFTHKDGVITGLWATEDRVPHSWRAEYVPLKVGAP